MPVAQVIRRFPELGMPVDEVRSMLNAPDDATGNKVIIAHLDRMQAQLAETTSTVVSLRGLLEGPALSEPVEYRHVAPCTSLAITSRLRVEEFEVRWGRAFSELRAELAASGLTRAGPDGALYPGEFFELEEAEVTAYVPVVEPAGGLLPAAADVVEIPGAELAVMVHEGGYGDTDRTYGGARDRGRHPRSGRRRPHPGALPGRTARRRGVRRRMAHRDLLARPAAAGSVSQQST